MGGRSVSDLEPRLLRPAEPATFSDAELDGLSEPVRRSLAAAIAARGGAEAVWVPTSLLPRFGVASSARDPQHVTARDRVGAFGEVTIRAPGGWAGSTDRWADSELLCHQVTHLELITASS